MKQKNDFTIIGRILSHTSLTTKTIPTKLSALTYAILGKHTILEGSDDGRTAAELLSPATTTASSPSDE